VGKVPNAKTHADVLYVLAHLDMLVIHMLDASKVLVYLMPSAPTTKLVKTIIVLTHVQLLVVKERIVEHKTM